MIAAAIVINSIGCAARPLNHAICTNQHKPSKQTPFCVAMAGPYVPSILM
jgi:hypothetical protein